MDKFEVAKQIYYSPENPASFGGIDKLYRSLRPYGFSREDVVDFLSSQDVYTLHKDRRFNFKRNKVLSFSKDFQWMADLADMQKYSRKNHGFKYILVVIDVFTKYVWARALKSKRPEDMTNAFSDIFERSGRKPLRLQTDRGREFDSKTMKDFYRKNGIIYFTSWNKTYKCSVVERVNRTIKSKMYRYFTSKDTTVWVDILDKIIESYNNSYHRTIKMTPVEACYAPTNVIFENIYGKKWDDQTKSKIPKLKEGDVVRVSYDPGVFDKSYWKTHTDELARIESIKPRQYPMYTLRDWSGELVFRRFYEPELQKVSPNINQN